MFNYNTIKMKTKSLIFNSQKEFLNYLDELELLPRHYNRMIKESHVKTMADSIKEIGVQRAVSVVKTNCFSNKYEKYITDAQHMVNAILSLREKPLSGVFIVIENEMDNTKDIVRFISKLNSTAKNWSLYDYLNAWVTEEIDSYIYLKNLKEETGFAINPLIEAFTGTLSKGNHTFKNGTLKINKKQGENLIKFYEQCVKFGLRSSNSAFSAIVRLKIQNPKLNEKKFFEIISNSPYYTNKRFNRTQYEKSFAFDLRQISK